MWSILVASGNKETYQQFSSCMDPGIDISAAGDEKEALEQLRERRFDFFFIDINMLTASLKENGYKDSIKSFKVLYPTLDIIVMSSTEMMREAVAAVKDGASDYITYPIKGDEVRHVIKSIHESTIVKSELDYLRDQFWEEDSLEITKTLSSQMTKVYNKVKSVAPTISTVLLSGETGTGKGVLANLIHQHSNRRNSRFISVHCGAIPDTLLESELFGHEKGAFTGAVRRKLGKFEIANHGTIFLDEIGTITPAAQIKLLQVLQDGTFQRVGGEVTINTDVRVIAATNMDLKQMCEEGRFRKDLYYRLNVFPIELPLLRDRREDIPHLANVFLSRMNRLNTKLIKGISPKVMDAFMNYPWPGNIRELENLIERAYILETSMILEIESFPGELYEYSFSEMTPSMDNTKSIAYVRRKAVEEVEKRYLRDLMDENRGKIRKSAEIAGISTRQLHKLLTKYGIHKEEFKTLRTNKK
jgi:DNA-binding NtrC family response regulator